MIGGLFQMMMKFKSSKPIYEMIDECKTLGFEFMRVDF